MPFSLEIHLKGSILVPHTLTIFRSVNRQLSMATLEASLMRKASSIWWTLFEGYSAHAIDTNASLEQDRGKCLCSSCTWLRRNVWRRLEECFSDLYASMGTRKVCFTNLLCNRINLAVSLSLPPLRRTEKCMQTRKFDVSAAARGAHAERFKILMSFMTSSCLHPVLNLIKTDMEKLPVTQADMVGALQSEYLNTKNLPIKAYRSRGR